MQLNPRPVRGSWDDGRTLDIHIHSSEFVGYNEYGHAQFESTRTELGELLYRLKYKGDQSAIAPIAQAAFDFVCGWNPGIDVIVPTPPSKSRAVQPLFQIADEVGRLLSLPVDKTSVRKTKATPEFKNVDDAKRLEVLGGAHSIEGDALLRTVRRGEVRDAAQLSRCRGREARERAAQQPASADARTRAPLSQI